MMVFFTTIGLGASFKLFKIGGKILILYFVCCAFLAICQNFIGISLAKVLHIKPLLGLTIWFNVNGRWTWECGLW